MADIASTDVTYTEQPGGGHTSTGRRTGIFKIQFGDGSLTYPAGGVPLLKAKLGCPNAIEEFTIFDSHDADGRLYKYDAENVKVRIYNPGGSHAHNLLVKGGQAAAGTAALAHYATDILGKEAATDATITGADSATKGGVLSATSQPGTEFTGASTVVAATTLYVKVVGW